MVGKQEVRPYIKVYESAFGVMINGENKLLPRWEGQDFMFRNDDVIKVIDGYESGIYKGEFINPEYQKKGSEIVLYDNKSKVVAYEIYNKENKFVAAYIEKPDGSMCFMKDGERPVDVPEKVMEQIKKAPYKHMEIRDHDDYEKASRGTVKRGGISESDLAYMVGAGVLTIAGASIAVDPKLIVNAACLYAVSYCGARFALALDRLRRINKANRSEKNPIMVTVRNSKGRS